MKRLYLIRHAKSSWKDPSLEDRERPLNKRGKRDAPKMAKRLKKRGDIPDLMVSSPARRALKTARTIVRGLDYPKKKIVVDRSLYGSGMSGALDAVRRIDDAFDRVMIVGHNPDLTELANYLTDYRVDNIPTCSVFCMDFDLPSWKAVSRGTGRFVYFDFPKKPLICQELREKAGRGGQCFILEKDGIPVAGIIDVDELEDYLELQNPELKKQIREGYAAYRRGEGRDLDELLAELKSEQQKGKKKV